ncbi:MAG: hypothetical protein HZA50_16890 [Planctomycetes bacterium]|nr:hypothetical protein [Planctomycetota bacterium]
MRKKIVGPIRMADLLFGLAVIAILAAIILPCLHCYYDDPGVPPWVNENTSVFDLVRPGENGLISKKWRYLQMHYRKAEVVKALIQYIESLPYVEVVSPSSHEDSDSRVDIYIKTKNGEAMFYGIGKCRGRG